MTPEPAEIARGLSEAQREAVAGSYLTRSGGQRLHWKYAGPVMQSLTKLKMLAPDSSYLTPLGLAVRQILLAQQTEGSPS